MKKKLEVTPLSIPYFLLRIIKGYSDSVEPEPLSFREIMDAYAEIYGQKFTSNSALQGSLARLRAKSLVRTVYAKKKSTGDVSALLKYKITNKGIESLNECYKEMAQEVDHVRVSNGGILAPTGI